MLKLISVYILNDLFISWQCLRFIVIRFDFFILFLFGYFIIKDTVLFFQDCVSFYVSVLVFFSSSYINCELILALQINYKVTDYCSVFVILYVHDYFLTMLNTDWVQGAWLIYTALSTVVSACLVSSLMC
jgi:hypothetical protein